MTTSSNHLFSSPDRQSVFRIFFLGVFIFLLYQFALMFSPFFGPLLSATTLALIFFPAHRRILRSIEDRPSVAAAVSTTLISLMVVLPVILFTWLMIREAAIAYPSAQRWMQQARLEDNSLLGFLPGPIKSLWLRLQTLMASFGVEMDLQALFLKSLDQVARKLSAFGTKIVKNIVLLTFNLLILVFALFFFFRDGPKFIHWIMSILPMEMDHKKRILLRMDETLSAVVRGVFLTASVQGLLAGIGFAMIGLNFGVLLSFATAFLALIPFVGAAAIWIPVTIYLLVTGSLGKGLFMALWGGLVVSSVDNFLKPILIGEKAKLPIFLLFFGILGGLQIYGFLGILIGPLMIASVMSFAKIYREQFQQPDEDPVEPSPAD